MLSLALSSSLATSCAMWLPPLHSKHAPCAPTSINRARPDETHQTQTPLAKRERFLGTCKNQAACRARGVPAPAARISRSRPTRRLRERQKRAPGPGARHRTVFQKTIAWRRTFPRRACRTSPRSPGWSTVVRRSIAFCSPAAEKPIQEGPGLRHKRVGTRARR